MPDNSVNGALLPWCNLRSQKLKPSVTEVPAAFTYLNNKCMKKILLLFVLLTTALGSFARDVKIHLTDLRGESMSELKIDFLGDELYTDENGYFTITGLTGGGTYYFSYYTGPYSLRQVSFNWDGGSPEVEVQLSSCYITLLLTGLSEEEMNEYGNMEIYLSSPSLGGGSYRFENGKVSLWWEYTTLQWTVYDRLFGETTSSLIDLTTTSGPIEVNPLKGKYRVTFGSVIGRDGQPITEYTIDGIDPSQQPDGVITYWRSAGENYYIFQAPGYYYIAKAYTVNNEDVTVNVDLRECVAVTLQAKDRDGSPLTNAVLTDAYRRDTLDITNENGECTFYTLPKERIDLTLQPNKLFYPQQTTSFSIGSEDKVVTMGYEGYQLVSAKIIGGAQFIAPYEDYWSGEIKWGQNAKIRMKHYYSEGNENFGEVSDYYMQYEQQGNDILVGKLIDNREEQYQEACLDLTFLYTSPRLLPAEGTYAPLTDDIYTEYDVTNHVPVTLEAPEEFRFDEYIKIDNQEINSDWGSTSFTIYMPQGTYTWAPKLTNTTDGQSYPYGKAQEFTAGADGLTVTYPFDINNYSAIRFTLLDQNGQPMKGAIEIFEDDKFYKAPISSVTTKNSDGTGIAYLSEPGTYYYRFSGYIWDYEHNYSRYYMPQSGQIEVGESVAEQTISYAGYHVLDLQLAGDSFSSVSFHSLSIDGTTLSPSFSNENGLYRQIHVIPAGTVTGRVSLTDKKEHRGVLSFTAEMGNEDQVYTIETNNMHAVDFTINDVPYDTQQEPRITIFDNQNASYYTLLMPGSYYAVFHPSEVNYRDTLYFDITNQDVTLNFEYNPDDFHAVTLSCINAPMDIIEISYYIGDDDAYATYAKFPNGTYPYHISRLFTANDKTVYANITGNVEVADEDVEIVVDLSEYTFCNVVLRMADGSHWTSEDYYMELTTPDGQRMPLGLWEPEFMLALPTTGTYKVRAYDYDKGKNFYGTLTVPENASGTLVITLSDNVDAIEDAQADAEHTLAATWTSNGLHIAASGSAPVTVSLYSINGNLLLNQEVAPGTTLPATNLGKGIYLVRLKQGNIARTQKLQR